MHSATSTTSQRVSRRSLQGDTQRSILGMSSGAHRNPRCRLPSTRAYAVSMNLVSRSVSGVNCVVRFRCGPARVISERHFSPLKAQAAATAATVTLSALGGVASGMHTAPLMWAHLVSVETAFWAFLAACAAGVTARGFTGYVRDRHTGQLDERTADVRERCATCSTVSLPRFC